MGPTSSPSQSAEDYLERIHELIEEKGYARVVDIANSLHVRQASVTSMVQKLGELGYLNYEKYRGLVLTERGKAVATGIQRRHETLARFFSLFGLDRETQQRDIDRTWKRINESAEEDAQRLMDEMAKQQPFIVAYLLAVEETMMSGEQRGQLMLIGLILWKIFSIENSALRSVSKEDLEAAEEAN